MNEASSPVKMVSQNFTKTEYRKKFFEITAKKTVFYRIFGKTAV